MEPGIDRATLAKRLMAADPRYFSTYYAIDAVNFRPARFFVGAGHARCRLSADRDPGRRRRAARSVLCRAEEHHAPLQGRVLHLQQGRRGAPLQPAADRCRVDQGACRSATSPPSPTATAPPHPARTTRHSPPRANSPRASLDISILPEQRLQRRLELLVAGALRRQQHDRVIGRDRALGIVKHDEVVFRDQPVAGVAGDDVDLAGGDGGIHEIRLHGPLAAERKPVGLPQRSPFRPREEFVVAGDRQRRRAARRDRRCS